MKKGQENAAMVKYILLAMAALVLILIATLVKNTIYAAFRDSGCETSVLTRTTFNVQADFYTIKNEMNVNCPAYDLTFEDEKLEIMSKGEEVDTIKFKKEREGELNNSLVNRMIAKELSACWKKFGAGDLDAFHIPKTALGRLVGGNDQLGCITCAKIDFDLEKPRIFTGFKEYLESTEINTYSQQSVTEGNSLYDYIAMKGRFCDEDKYSKGENCWESFATEKKINTNLSFDSQKDYVIVFMREGVEKEKGTMNAYVMNHDTQIRVCERTLPYYVNTE